MRLSSRLYLLPSTPVQKQSPDVIWVEFHPVTIQCEISVCDISCRDQVSTGTIHSLTRWWKPGEQAGYALCEKVWAMSHYKSLMTSKASPDPHPPPLFASVCTSMLQLNLDNPQFVNLVSSFTVLITCVPNVTGCITLLPSYQLCPTDRQSTPLNPQNIWSQNHEFFYANCGEVNFNPKFSRGELKIEVLLSTRWR